MPTPEEVEAQLTGPGGPFEIVEERVFGEPTPVFKERHPHLRAILAQSADHGDAEYIVCGDLRIGFAEHARIVASVARALRERFGVEKGDRVAILAANCPEWVLSFWAALSLGAIPVGLNGWWAGDEILYGLGDCAPKLLIGDRKRLARIGGADPGVPVVEIEADFEKLWHHDLEAPLPDTPIDEDDPATILYTSGTTGRPKGAVNTHRNIIALARVQLFHGLRALLSRPDGQGANPFGGRNCALINTPLFHVSGLYAGAVTLLAAGVKTVWTLGRFDPVATLQLIERERVTNWGPMGTMIYRIVNHPDVGRYDLSSLRNVGSGGAPVSRELQQRMREVFPNIRAQMGLGYGLTESTALATLNYGEQLERHPDSVGRPLPTIAVEIRDAEGRPVPEGVEGEIHIHGPLVMKEYWGKPEATAEAIRPGRWLRTGDIGRLEEGRLYVDSRRRDLILRGGENVYPVEIEQRLEAHPDVREAAVVGVPHPELGQEVKAIVVPVEGARPDPAALARWVADALAYYKVPAHWEVRAEPLPRNASGKVLKNVLSGDAENPFIEESLRLRQAGPPEQRGPLVAAHRTAQDHRLRDLGRQVRIHAQDLPHEGARRLVATDGFEVRRQADARDDHVRVGGPGLLPVLDGPLLAPRLIVDGAEDCRRDGVIRLRIEAERAPHRLERRQGAALTEEGEAAYGMGDVEVRVEIDRPVGARDGLLELAPGVVDVREGDVRVEGRRIVFERLSRQALRPLEEPGVRFQPIAYSTT